MLFTFVWAVRGVHMNWINKFDKPLRYEIYFCSRKSLIHLHTRVWLKNLFRRSETFFEMLLICACSQWVISWALCNWVFVISIQPNLLTGSNRKSREIPHSLMISDLTIVCKWPWRLLRNIWLHEIHPKRFFYRNQPHDDVDTIKNKQGTPKFKSEISFLVNIFQT